MSADDVQKSLKKWLTKAKEMPAPPAPTERRGRTAETKRVLRQLNLKVGAETYDRIKGLAYRDRLSLVALLDAMLDLYEQEHGALEKRR